MALNRTGIADMLADMLMADTGVLYGPTALLRCITTNKVNFEKAKVDVQNPYKMYINVSTKETVEKRGSCTFELYTADYRIEGLHTDPKIADQNIDKIDERIDLLIDYEFSSGDMFTDYYTDSLAQVYDAEFQSSSADIEARENKIVVECEGTISIYVYREAA